MAGRDAGGEVRKRIPADPGSHAASHPFRLRVDRTHAPIERD